MYIIVFRCLNRKQTNKQTNMYCRIISVFRDVSPFVLRLLVSVTLGDSSVCDYAVGWLVGWFCKCHRHHQATVIFTFTRTSDVKGTTLKNYVHHFVIAL